MQITKASCTLLSYSTNGHNLASDQHEKVPKDLHPKPVLSHMKGVEQGQRRHTAEQKMSYIASKNR